MGDALEQVREYYERNTRGFLARGQGGAQGVIHRAVWGPGVRRREQAFRYVEDVIARRVVALPTPAGEPRHVLDLGCGVGASLCYLAARYGLRGSGVTLSPSQARLAVDHVRGAGLQGRVRCVAGDFCALPAAIGPADAAFAIESFVHALDARQFFTECARVVRPGGVLAVCDDFLGPTTADSPREQDIIARFRRGWRVSSLFGVQALCELARELGFEHEETLELTRYLELGRPRDRAIAPLVKLLHALPIESPAWLNLVGGDALQRGLRSGVFRHALVFFRRVDGPG